jgi:hypothetical protein
VETRNQSSARLDPQPPPYRRHRAVAKLFDSPSLMLFICLSFPQQSTDRLGLKFASGEARKGEESGQKKVPERASAKIESF